MGRERLSRHTCRIDAIPKRFRGASPGFAGGCAFLLPSRLNAARFSCKSPRQNRRRKRNVFTKSRHRQLPGSGTRLPAKALAGNGCRKAFCRAKSTASPRAAVAEQNAFLVFCDAFPFVHGKSSQSAAKGRQKAKKSACPFLHNGREGGCPSALEERTRAFFLVYHTGGILHQLFWQEIKNFLPL